MPQAKPNHIDPSNVLAQRALNRLGALTPGTLLQAIVEGLEGNPMLLAMLQDTNPETAPQYRILGLFSRYNIGTDTNFPGYFVRVTQEKAHLVTPSRWLITFTYLPDPIDPTLLVPAIEAWDYKMLKNGVPWYRYIGKRDGMPWSSDPNEGGSLFNGFPIVEAAQLDDSVFEYHEIVPEPEPEQTEPAVESGLAMLMAAKGIDAKIALQVVKDAQAAGLIEADPKPLKKKATRKKAKKKTTKKRTRKTK